LHPPAYQQLLFEDTLAMADEYPAWNAYWEDKVPKFHKIRIPTYYTSNWNHFHNMGSFEGFRKIRSRRKWMRAHREFEWPDTYNNANLEDLRKFFDRYLKDVRNGWEFTPRVRIEVMDAYTYDYQTNRPENEFPLARTQYKKLYLDSSNCSMSYDAPKTEAKASFDGETGLLNYDIRFLEDTEITGYMSFHGHVSVDGHDDGDLFFTIKKIGQDGKTEVPIYVLNEEHPGAWTKLRLSWRELSEKLSTEFKPEQSFQNQQKLKPGEIVTIDVAFVPYSRIWHKGETLRLQIAGRYIRDESWFERLKWITDNKGTINIHTGGEYDSYLTIPVIPPRWQSGDYIYR
jgi:predicted acyl esterase